MPDDWRISPNAISEPKVIAIDIKKYNQAISKIERLEKDLKYARECNEVKDKYWDTIRVERNSFLLEKERLKERVEELETELYFCNRNKRIGEIVDGN
tara:strand:+ start:151 stop:444 length:294 start_codon:yes stop_codon:yes gene_type:complete